MSDFLSKPLLLSGRRSGLTLIELMLSVVMAALVVTVVFSVYHTVAIVRQGQEDRARRYNAASEALDRLAHDVTCAVILPDNTTNAFIFHAPAAGVTTQDLVFCATLLPEGEKDVRWFEVLQVTYRLSPEGDLFRETRPLAGAVEQVATNLLARFISKWTLRAYDGKEWHDAWPLEKSDPLPRALKIELTAGAEDQAKTFRTETFLPVANPIESKLSRKSQKAAGASAAKP